jgi:hypothetical protein
MSQPHKPAQGVELPMHWSTEQALAAFEILDLLRDALWAAYGPEIERAMRADRITERPVVPVDPGEPF